MAFPRALSAETLSRSEWTPGVRRSLLLLALSCSMEAFAYTVCVPFLTTSLRAQRSTSVTVASLVFVAYTLGSICVTPLVQPVIRACGGCSRATTFALLVLGLGELLSIVARAPLALFGARFVAGMAGGLVWSSVLSACSILAGQSGSMAVMFGVVLSAVSIGTMSGPALGGILFRVGGWPLPFLAVAGACAILAALVLALLERLPLEPERQCTAEAFAADAAASCPDAGCQLLAAGRQVGAHARTRRDRSVYGQRAPALVLLSVAVGATVYSSIDSVLPTHIEDCLRRAEPADGERAGAGAGPGARGATAAVVRPAAARGEAALERRRRLEGARAPRATRIALAALASPAAGGRGGGSMSGVSGVRVTGGRSSGRSSATLCTSFVFFLISVRARNTHTRAAPAVRRRAPAMRVRTFSDASSDPCALPPFSPARPPRAALRPLPRAHVRLPRRSCATAAWLRSSAASPPPARAAPQRRARARSS